MILRYAQIRDFLPEPGLDDIDELHLGLREDQEVEKLCEMFPNHDSVTLSLQRYDAPLS